MRVAIVTALLAVLAGLACGVVIAGAEHAVGNHVVKP